MQSGIGRKVVISNGLGVLQVLPSVNQSLFIWRDTLLVPDLLLDLSDGIGGRHSHSARLAVDALHEQLNLICMQNDRQTTSTANRAPSAAHEKEREKEAKKKKKSGTLTRTSREATGSHGRRKRTLEWQESMAWRKRGKRRGVSANGRGRREGGQVDAKQEESKHFANEEKAKKTRGESGEKNTQRWKTQKKRKERSWPGGPNAVPPPPPPPAGASDIFPRKAKPSTQTKTFSVQLQWRCFGSDQARFVGHFLASAIDGPRCAR